MVKLYRRGFRTIVIRSDGLTPPSDWTRAPSPDEQAFAIREFAYAARRPPLPGPPTGVPKPHVNLSPGSAGEGHNQVLVVIASEFERIAVLFPAGSVANASLQKDAADIRALTTR